MQYPRLADGDHVRLLVVHPAAEKEPLVTSLIAASLRPAEGKILEYEALSYVWGLSTDKAHIRCNGVQLSITQTLHDALSAIRSENNERKLWVDQLCINQDDIAERNQQVSIMGDIYRSAERVVVWLGPADDETPVLWDLLYKLGELRHFDGSETYQLPLGHRHDDINPTQDESQSVQHAAKSGDKPALPDLPPGSAPEWQAMERFFRRAWFLRTWTFQEVVLSQRCELVCGSYKMPWIDLADASKAIAMAGYDKYLDHAQIGISIVQVQRVRLCEREYSALRSLLEANRSRAATDPKDKIYALRGVIEPQVADKIQVNYEAPLGETYAAAVKTCIETGNALTVLGSKEYRRTQESKLEMPSWVPDWRYKTSVSVDLSMRRLDDSTFYSASRHESVQMLATPDPRKLTLKGFVVAKITRFSEVRRWLDFDVYRMGIRRFQSERFARARWMKMYKRGVENINFPVSSLKRPERADNIMASIWNQDIDDPLSSDQQVEMAYRRTVTADLYPRPQSRLNTKETSDGFPAFVSWQKAGFPNPVPEAVLHEHDIYLTQAMSNREFFIAEEGEDAYMGVVMGVPTDGDCVCILLGGDTPFVLRPKDHGEWEFLAEAYVHGIMDGEAMMRTQEEECKYQDFVLS